MGNRLSKIYTRTGDDGTTGLGNGDRIPKDAPRVEAYGTVDELNSAIGVLTAPALPQDISELLNGIQHRLFDLGGELCIPESTAITPDDVTGLELALDTFNAELPPLREFVLPGGSARGAACHMARAICRRAERRVISLAAAESVNSHAVKYLNRLSDLLFVLARVLTRADGVEEVLWQSQRTT